MVRVSWGVTSPNEGWNARPYRSELLDLGPVLGARSFVSKMLDCTAGDLPAAWGAGRRLDASTE